ncbi:MAG: GNAT family N-acetyltransferase [Alphaproteobacteria bacterium]|nr:GNAT family N-acetyltransferase [Alphaproteobacteria bacterium]
MQSFDKFVKSIKTPRLELRIVLPTKENAKNFSDVVERNRDYLEAWQGHFETLHGVDDFLKELKYRYNQISKNYGVMFRIYKNNELIGRIRFFDDGGCKIGYWLIQSENGHGYMSEALSALETELFKFGFEKIILEIDDGNTLSERVAIRNGYKLEKRLPMDSWAKCIGKCDTLVYAKYQKMQ